jgi:hypothetical protein
MTDNDRHEEISRQQGQRLEGRLAQVPRRIDQAYRDKLDGKIGEEFWMRKSSEWQTEERGLCRLDDMVSFVVRGKPISIQRSAQACTVGCCRLGKSNASSRGIPSKIAVMSACILTFRKND